MKKVLLLFFASAMLMAQEHTINLSLGSSYSNEVYFKFSDESSHSYDKNIWDLAFLRNDPYEKGIRVNEGKGLSVYEASNDVNDWDMIDDLSAAEGEALHNSSTDWIIGAFDMGSDSFGWGYYDTTIHHVVGSVIFLIEDYASSTYYKMMIEDYYGAYTIKYALWNGNGWDADQTAVIPNSTNDGHIFNFFNLENGEIVEASPAASEWDIVFKKYSEIVYTNTGDPVPYIVTGVLHNPSVTVAHVEESTSGNWADTGELSFSSDINSIGYEWKQLNSSWAYEIVPDQVFYLKSNNVIYRMYFTDFAGSSSGDLTFVYSTENMATVDTEGNVQFAVYPNPVKNNKITLVYDNAKALGDNAIVDIYNIAGQRVFNTTLNNASGLYQRDIQLNNLAKGVYILKFTLGNDVQTKKIIIQ